MKPDIIVTWPTSIDYVWWRWQLQQHRKKFDKVIIVFHDMGRPDLRPFLTKVIKDAIFIEMKEPGQSWRHNAINLALNWSKSEWIWFTEMDFFFKEDYGFVKMFEGAHDCDGVAYEQTERYHPACLLIRRDTLDKTDCFFDPAYYDKKPGEEGLTALLDHFVVLTWQLRKFAKIKSLRSLGLVDGEDFYHMEDLTHNYDRVKVGDVRETSRPYDFLIYNAYSRTIPVKQCKEWLEVTYLAEYEMSKLGKFINW